MEEKESGSAAFFNALQHPTTTRRNMAAGVAGPHVRRPVASPNVRMQLWRARGLQSLSFAWCLCSAGAWSGQVLYYSHVERWVYPARLKWATAGQIREVKCW